MPVLCLVYGGSARFLCRPTKTCTAFEHRLTQSNTFGQVLTLPIPVCHRREECPHTEPLNCNNKTSQRLALAGERILSCLTPGSRSNRYIRCMYLYYRAVPGLLVLLDLVPLALCHLKQQLPARRHACCQLSIPLCILLSQSSINHAVPLSSVQLLLG